MATDVSEVIRTTATHGQCAWVSVFLNVNLVKSGIIIVFDPESHGSQQVIMLHKFNVANGMDFLSSADHFIGTIVVNELEEM
jgi:hypothetical protein